jgi:hypothetical protein
VIEAARQGAVLYNVFYPLSPAIRHAYSFTACGEMLRWDIVENDGQAVWIYIGANNLLIQGGCGPDGDNWLSYPGDDGLPLAPFLYVEPEFERNNAQHRKRRTVTFAGKTQCREYSIPGMGKLVVWRGLGLYSETPWGLGMKLIHSAIAATDQVPDDAFNQTCDISYIK